MKLFIDMLCLIDKDIKRCEKEVQALKFFSGKEDKIKEKKIEEILLANYDRYYRLAYSYVHNEEDAGDIVQNGAIKQSKTAIP